MRRQAGHVLPKSVGGGGFMFRVKAPPVDGITGKVRTEEDAELALTGKPLPSDDDEAALLIPEDEAALLQKKHSPWKRLARLRAFRCLRTLFSYESKSLCEAPEPQTGMFFSLM